MTAGLAYSFGEGMSSEDTFRLCMALAGAEAETEGTNPPFKDRVMELFDSHPDMRPMNCLAYCNKQNKRSKIELQRFGIVSL